MKSTLKFLYVWSVFCIAINAAIIKEGDVLDIQVQSHEEFSGKYTVTGKGTIEYPLLADYIISGLSTLELMNELTFRLAKHINNPLVLVTVVDKPQITITVLGQVKNPGPIATYLGVSIQEAIQLAGGPSEWADIERVKIIHKGNGDENAEYFDLKQFLKFGAIDQMPQLFNEDIIILLSEDRIKKIKVIGAVNKPGFFTLEDSINVFEMIYMAGGPAEKADLSKIRRFFKGDGNKTMEEVIDIQAYIDNGNMDAIPMVNEGDVIIIYSKWFDWKMLLTILSNILLFIVTIQSIRGAIAK